MKDFLLNLYKKVATNGINSELEEYMVSELQKLGIAIDSFDLGNYKDVLTSNEWKEIFKEAVNNNKTDDLLESISFRLPLDINDAVQILETNNSIVKILNYIELDTISKETFDTITHNKEILSGIICSNYEKLSQLKNDFIMHVVEEVKKSGDINHLNDLLLEDAISNAHIVETIKNDVDNYIKIPNLLFYNAKGNNSNIVIYMLENGRKDYITEHLDEIIDKEMINEQEIEDINNIRSNSDAQITTRFGVEVARISSGGLTLKLFKQIGSDIRKSYAKEFLEENIDNPEIFKIINSNELTELSKMSKKITPEMLKLLRPQTLNDLPISSVLLMIENGVKFSRDEVANFSSTCKSDNACMTALCHQDPNSILEYKGTNKELVDIFFERLEEYPNPTQYKSDNRIIIEKLLDINPDYIKSFDNNNKDMYTDDKLVQKYISIRGDDYESLIMIPGLKIPTNRIKELIDRNPNYVLFDNSHNNMENLKYAIEKGFTLTYENYRKLPFQIQNETIEMALETDKRNIANYYGDNIKYKYIRNYMLPHIEDEDYEIKWQEMIESEVYKHFVDNVVPIYDENFYKYGRDELIANYGYVEYALTALKIDVKDYLSTNIHSSTNFVEYLTNLCKTNSIRKFQTLLSTMSHDHENNMDLYRQLNSLLLNFDRYPKICELIMSEKVSEEEKQKLNYLFSKRGTIDESMIESFNDLTNIDNMILENCKKKYESSESLDEKKDIICSLLFDKSYEEMVLKTKIYGTVEDFELLRRDNSKNAEIHGRVDDAIFLTSIVQGITSIDNEKEGVLDSLFQRCANNPELLKEFMMIFSKYDDFMREFYEMELMANITNVDDYEIPKDLITEDQKTGLKIYDFTSTDYMLLTHVLSGSETLEDIISGKYKTNMMTICLSSIGYLGQKYFDIRSGTEGITFGYTTIPKGNYLMSSVRDMGSNRHLTIGSMEVSNIEDREQRGLKETTRNHEQMAGNNADNNEFLLYREGLKPTCIILRDGREPTEEEIKIAKENGLFFVKTQTPEKEMENTPTKLEKKESVKKVDSLLADKEKLLALRDELMPRTERKVMIMADPHGLYEPTLALLENARQQGITEIYSLGDNIGNGANPSETMDLLTRYGVKSIKGNHELYLLQGPDAFKEHFDRTGGYETQVEESMWIGDRMRPDQVEQIAAMPNERVIEMGGKKILLCHSLNDYNTEEQAYNPEDYDRVFQGHVHFSSEQGNVTTVRAAGMGYSDSLDVGKAFCYVLTETKDGYKTEPVEIEYNYKLTQEMLKYEAVPQEGKMQNWVSRAR